VKAGKGRPAQAKTQPGTNVLREVLRQKGASREAVSNKGIL